MWYAKQKLISSCGQVDQKINHDDFIAFQKAPFLYQHVIGHSYATLQQFKESRDKKHYVMSYPVSGVYKLPRVSFARLFTELHQQFAQPRMRLIEQL